MTRPGVLRAHAIGKPRFLDADETLFPTRSKRSLIQWPTEREIQEVSGRLARVRKVGIRSEAKGDYFSSGNLAYQMQEILKASAELLKNSQRLKP